MLLWIIIFTFIGSIISLLIASALFLKSNFGKKTLSLLIAFAAGAMLTAAFFDLLPEAMEEGVLEMITDYQGILGMAFFGLVTFFFLERSLLWYHHHACLQGDDCQGTKPTAALIMSGDTLHNFLDGVTIAAAFLANFHLGIITSLAVFFHEIPQEITDFGVLISSGMKKRSVFIFNGLSSLAALAGAILAFYFLQTFESFIPFLIAFAAGNFIYIAASDLIPELHQHFEKETALSQTLSFLLGVLIIFITIQIFR